MPLMGWGKVWCKEAIDINLARAHLFLSDRYLRYSQDLREATYKHSGRAASGALRQ